MFLPDDVCPLELVDGALELNLPRAETLREPRGRPRFDEPLPGIRGFTVVPYKL